MIWFLQVWGKGVFHFKTECINITFESFLPTDLQNVNITLRILFRPVTSQLPRIFTSIGEDYDERVLPSITTEVLKSVVVSIIQPVNVF